MSRLKAGGRIDRSRPLPFTFNGEAYTGFAGDTLASALLANDVRVVARSVTLGRPRGIFAAGVEEPNALVQVGLEPMLRATQVELVDGLEAVGLNGKGRVSLEPEPGRFDKVYAHCEVLVVGGGRAGLTAAQAAASTGDRVILVDEQAELGGRLLSAPGNGWLDETVAALRSMAEVRLLDRATAYGYYDQNLVMIAQRKTGGGRLWQIRARQVVLATGAHERPLVFANNDRPGILLAGAVRTYLNRYAVAPGRRAVVFTNNDSTNSLVGDLRGAGVAVEAVIDVRAGIGVVDTAGDEHGLRQVTIGPLDGDLSAARTVDCDLLCISGGFNPAIHLFSQAQGRLRYEERLACFVPDAASRGVRVTGSANGELDHLGVGVIQACWTIPGRQADGSTHFIDLERDVTLADVRRALGTGMRSVEHIKRYTTIGTGSDQGKTAGVNEGAIVAAQLGQPVAAVGTTTFRPPYAPVVFALMAGRNRGALFDPVRVTSIHPWHLARGAVFENVGQWKRPWYYPQPGEAMEAAVQRECAAARQGVGVQDVSTLGKIDIQGPDTLEFLNRIYTNALDTLAVGSCRYSVMCKPDGMFFDDGVVIRLGPQRYLATTTTGGAASVLDHLEEWLQTEWPDLRVRLTSVTDQWAAVAVVGPRSREVLSRLAPGLPVDPESMPFMTWREARVAQVAARVHRITFSGELAFEVWVPSWYGLALWEAIMTQGGDITPYGTEAMHVLRAEKGYVIVGQDTDGTVTPQDLGMGWIVSRKKKDFIGRRSHQRADTSRPDRKHLVGLLPDDPDDVIPEGSQLVAEPDRQPPPTPMLGHVTSSYRSVALGRSFALAMVKSGRERLGSTVYVQLPDRVVAATITEPVFYDRENQRRDS